MKAAKRTSPRTFLAMDVACRQLSHLPPMCVHLFLLERGPNSSTPSPWRLIPHDFSLHDVIITPNWKCTLCRWIDSQQWFSWWVITIQPTIIWRSYLALWHSRGPTTQNLWFVHMAQFGCPSIVFIATGEVPKVDEHIGAWEAYRIDRFIQCSLTSPAVIVWKVVDQHLFLNTIPNNFTIGIGQKCWCDRAVSLQPKNCPCF